jgi:methyl-accepting chemotaxis protein
MVRISAPIDGLRKRLGVAVLDLDLTTLAGRIADNGSLQRMLTDNGGTPLVGSSVNPLAHAALSTPDESAQSGEHMCLAAHVTAGNETWAVVHAVAISEVMSGVDALQKVAASAGSTLQRDLWLAAGGIAGLGIIATMLLLSSVTRPLRRIALLIDTCAAGVAAAARQLSSGSSQLAELADRSFSTVQMVTNEVTTISSTVKETNATAEQAAQVVANAASSGERCRNAIDRANTAMSAVAASSHHNRQVATHIQDIAFQTRIIAINAAIENRRASEKIGTFGVIVSHVKRLANESRDAARSSDQLLREGIDRTKGAASASHEARTAVLDLESALDQAGDVAETMSSTATLVDNGVARIKGGLTDLQRLGTSTSHSANDQAQLSKDLDLRSADLAQLVKALTDVLGQNHHDKKRKKSKIILKAQSDEEHPTTTTT